MRQLNYPEDKLNQGVIALNKLTLYYIVSLI